MNENSSPRSTASDWVRLGREALSAGDLDGAENAFAQALALQPTGGQTRLFLGRVAFRKGDHARALACADAYFAEGGSAYAGLVLRAQSLLELGDAAAFEAAVRQCEAHASCDVVPFVLRAEQARRSGDLKSEARHLADAVERYPGVFSARFRLANAWLVMGNCEQAVRVMSQANLSRLSEREIFFTADLMEKCRRSDLARQAVDHVDPEGEFAGLELLMAALDGRVSPREALRRHAARRLREGP